MISPNAIFTMLAAPEHTLHSRRCVDSLERSACAFFSLPLPSTVRGSKIPGGYKPNLLHLRADRHNGAPRVAGSVGFVTKKTAKL